jgi:hypothetical protein
MKNALMPFCLIVGLLLAVLPGSAQTADNRATLVIVDSRDPYLFRDYSIKFFDENGKQVAAMKRCEIIRLSMTPGPHKFRSNKDKKKVVSINAVAGGKYYAQAGIRNMTIMPMSMQVDFNLITREEAEFWVSKCKLPASALDAESPVSE